ncbi:MAG: PhzF family phenazine biosynthesis protein [Alphaproteobacteria bacterium]|nr:PhzF family phenazine biosynthesis protein [Alphaproteobacteria bacterium]
MKLPLYQVDAFTDKVFGGNPAAVCPLKEWLSNEKLQKIALENNLSETAFFVPQKVGYHLRWFTPAAEVDLCGHATLASAHILYEHLGYEEDKVTFQSRSGILTVTRSDQGLTMDLPSWEYEEVAPEDKKKIEQVLGLPTFSVLKGKSVWVAVLDSAEKVKSIKPDTIKILSLKDVIGLVVTAPGTEGVDFVSRFFAPQVGIDEDPVTGATHCLLAPYWGKIQDKTELSARQLSARGGSLLCNLAKEKRVEITGTAVTYLEGSINV